MVLSSQEDPPVTCVTPTHLLCTCSHCRLVPDKNLVAKNYSVGWGIYVRGVMIQSYFWEDEGHVGILCHSKHI